MVRPMASSADADGWFTPATVDSAHASSGILSGRILRIVVLAHGLFRKETEVMITHTNIRTRSHANIIIDNYHTAMSMT